MKVRWQVEDGYAGGSRPQKTEIDDEDWLECETQEERDALIEECVQEDFENNISWYIRGLEGVPEPFNRENEDGKSDDLD